MHLKYFIKHILQNHWCCSRSGVRAVVPPCRILHEDKLILCCDGTDSQFVAALDKRNGLLCLSLSDGSVIWKDGYRMTTKERNPHASMVWGEKKKGLAVILNARGDLILARLSPQGYNEKGRVHLLDGRWIWSHPAFSGQDIYARSDTEIIRVRISPPPLENPRRSR